MILPIDTQIPSISYAIAFLNGSFIAIIAVCLFAIVLLCVVVVIVYIIIFFPDQRYIVA